MPSVVAGVELINVLLGDISDHLLGVMLSVIGTQEKIRESIEPGFVSLASLAGELDSAARSNDDQALAVQSWRVRIVVRHNVDSLNLDALGPALGPVTRGGWIAVTPIQCSCIWMNPKVTAMPCLGHVGRTCLPGVLPQILANHSLSNGLYHARICAWGEAMSSSKAVGTNAILKMESGVDFRCK